MPVFENLISVVYSPIVACNNASQLTGQMTAQLNIYIYIHLECYHPATYKLHKHEVELLLLQLHN